MTSRSPFEMEVDFYGSSEVVQVLPYGKEDLWWARLPRAGLVVVEGKTKQAVADALQERVLAWDEYRPVRKEEFILRQEYSGYVDGPEVEEIRNVYNLGHDPRRVPVVAVEYWFRPRGPSWFRLALLLPNRVLYVGPIKDTLEEISQHADLLLVHQPQRNPSLGHKLKARLLR